MTSSDSSAADVRRRHDLIYADHVVPEFRFWQVGERLWAGRNPLSELDLRDLVARGVTHVLDLREESEWSGPGRYGAEAVAAAADVGIARFHVPIGDFSAPSDAALTQAAAWLDQRWAEPASVVFAHCRAGLQRTPTVLAVWLARREGIAFDAAVERLRRDGYPGRPLPEQRQAAERWLAESRLRGDQSLTSRIRGDLSLTSRLRGSLLGGALGDALGAPIEFLRWPEIRQRFGPRGLEHFEAAYGVPPNTGAITDDTQMTLFTVEGLIRSEVRGEARGTSHPSSVVHHAYRRWLLTQGERWPAAEPTQAELAEAEPSDSELAVAESADATPTSAPWEPDGWLIGEKFLHARRAPGNTCLAALRVPGPYGRLAANDSKGCGGVMRIAGVGFLYRAGEGVAVFRMGVEIAALTHGHPSGQLPAGVLAAAIHAIVHEGLSLPEALDAATAILREAPNHEETLYPLAAARALAAEGQPTAERVESLGGGWVAEEALAIAVYAALSFPEDLRAALVLAANHSGDSDSTAAICGQLLGAVLGEEALPVDWLAGLEGREVITRLADDFARQLAGEAPRMGEGRPSTPEAEAWWERYPGW